MTLQKKKLNYFKAEKKKRVEINKTINVNAALPMSTGNWLIELLWKETERLIIKRCM